MKKFFKYLVFIILAVISFMITPAYCGANDIEGNNFWLFMWSVYLAFMIPLWLYYVWQGIKNKGTIKEYFRRFFVLMVWIIIVFALWYCAINYIHTSEPKSVFDQPIKVKIVE